MTPVYKGGTTQELTDWRSETLDITLQDHEWATSRGRTYFTATDQYGREWNWDYKADVKSEAERDWAISYRDKDGISHEYHEKDGIWYDTWRDRYGNEHSVEASDSYILTEADVRGSPDDPLIGDVLKGGPTSINTNPDARDDTDDPVIGQVLRGGPTSIANPDPKPPDPYVIVPPNHDMSSTKLGDVPEPKVFVPPGSDTVLDPIPSSGPSPFGEAQNPQPAPPPSGGAGGSEAQNAPAPEPGTPGDPNAPDLVPYRDYIPFVPMAQDPTTGEWRNAYESEGGWIPDPEGGEVPTLPAYPGEEGAPPSPGGYDGSGITGPWLEGYDEEGAPTLPGGAGDGVRLPGMEGPFVDVMPVMVQDPTTGEWLVKVTDPATGELRSPEPGESPNPNLSELFDPSAPGPTLAPDLFNPNSPGPTLDPRLLLDPDSPGPTIDPALLDLTEPGPTIDPALLDPNSPGATLDPALFDPVAPGPTIDPGLLDLSAPGETIDPNLLDPSAPGETIDPSLLDPSSPGPTLDPAQLEHGIVEPGGVAEPAGVTDHGLAAPSLGEPPPPEPTTTPDHNLDDHQPGTL